MIYNQKKQLTKIEMYEKFSGMMDALGNDIDRIYSKLSAVEFELRDRKTRCKCGLPESESSSSDSDSNKTTKQIYDDIVKHKNTNLFNI